MHQLRGPTSAIYVQGATAQLRERVRLELSQGLAATTVLMLKCLIYQQVQYPLERMTVQLAGKPQMDDDEETLASCGVTPGATIYVANKIRGGGGGAGERRRRGALQAGVRRNTKACRCAARIEGGPATLTHDAHQRRTH